MVPSSLVVLQELLLVEIPLSHRPHPLMPESFFSLVSMRSSMLSRTSLMLSRPRLFWRSKDVLQHSFFLDFVSVDSSDSQRPKNGHKLK